MSLEETRIVSTSSWKLDEIQDIWEIVTSLQQKIHDLHTVAAKNPRFRNRSPRQNRAQQHSLLYNILVHFYNIFCLAFQNKTPSYTITMTGCCDNDKTCCNNSKREDREVPDGLDPCCSVSGQRCLCLWVKLINSAYRYCFGCLSSLLTHCITLWFSFQALRRSMVDLCPGPNDRFAIFWLDSMGYLCR